MEHDCGEAMSQRPVETWAQPLSRHVTSDIAAIAALGVAVLWILRGYLIGLEVPPFDFLGGYLTTAYSWWDLGGFFDPPSFLPFLRGGYPAHLAVQASGWYLPVGVVATVSEYTPWSAAALQALTVLWGVAGVYALARRFGMRPSMSFVAALAYLFSPGFFESASMPDIVRTWAFFPWLLFAASPQARTTAARVAVACLLWFQFFVGAYPGGIAAIAYLCVAWVVILGWRLRPRLGNYAAWLGLTVVPAVLMSTLKWVPYLVGGRPVGEIDNQIVVNLPALGTIAFPLGDGAIPNPPGLQSLYVVPIMLLCVPFFHRPPALVHGALGLCAVAVTLGLDLPPVSGWQEALPLLDESRFRTADFKVGLILGTIILGASGLDTILSRERRNWSGSWWYSRFAVSVALLIGLAALGLIGQYSPENAKKGLLWLALSALTVFGLVVRAVRFPSRGPGQSGSPTRGGHRATLTFAVSIAVIALGVGWADTSRGLWATPREAAELRLAGAPVQELITEQGPLPRPGRPARTGPSFPAEVGDPNTPDTIQYAGWNYGEYSHTPSLAGYANLRGQPNYLYFADATWNGDGSIWAAMRLPSMAWGVPVGESAEASSTCWESGTCDREGLQVTQWSANSVKISVAGQRAGTVAINEYAWPGWRVTVCGLHTCTTEPAVTGPGHVLLATSFESGTESITFTYETPVQRQSWILFWSGISLVTLGVLVTWVRRRSYT